MTVTMYTSLSLCCSFVFVLPGRDDEGRKIFVLRPGGFDTSNKRYTKVDMFRAFACVLDALLMDEMTQVNGTVTIIDFTGFTMKHQGYVTMDDRKNFIQSWQVGRDRAIKSA